MRYTAGILQPSTCAWFVQTILVKETQWEKPSRFKKVRTPDAKDFRVLNLAKNAPTGVERRRARSPTWSPSWNGQNNYHR